jgi:ankyrin repeat protein
VTIRIARTRSDIARLEKMKKAAASVEKVDGDLMKEEEEMKLKELITKISGAIISGEWSEYRLTLVEMDQHIMKLSREELQEESAYKEGEEDSVLTRVVAFGLPFATIARLCDALGIDTKGKGSSTAIIVAAYNGNYDEVDYLAMMKADLSIINIDGHDVYSIVKTSKSSSQEDKEQVYRVLKKHGVTGGIIKQGYRSPLSTNSESVPIPLPKRLAQEKNLTRFFIRVMTLDADELAKEAKELRDDGLGNALMYAAINDGMEVAIERLCVVWSSSVNTKNNSALTAIMGAAWNGMAANVDTLATMGTDLSLKSKNGDNVFHYAEESGLPPEKIAAVFKALSEHGVKSANIPIGFQSPLYFRSIYYEKNVRTQRWMNRSILMMCVSRVYAWSLSNQIEDVKYRTLPDDLPQLGCFICKCWFDVAGGGNKDDKPDNGVGRLIMQFYGGFNEGKAESPIKLIGMPAFGKNDHSLPSCSYCHKEYCEASGGGVELCCENVYYCRDGNCKKFHLPSHQAICVCDEVLQRRKESVKANEKAEEAAASLLAELGLEEEKESKKKNKKIVGSGQDSKKKTTKKGGNKKKK